MIKEHDRELATQTVLLKTGCGADEGSCHVFCGRFFFFFFKLDSGGDKIKNKAIIIMDSDSGAAPGLCVTPQPNSLCWVKRYPRCF